MRRVLPVSLLIFIAAPSSAETLTTLKQALKKTLRGAKKLSRQRFELTDVQKEKIRSTWDYSPPGKVTVYFGRDAEEALKAACVVVHQQGKEGPMRVAVGVRPDGKVLRVIILSYEEERGKPVAEIAFLRQFEGKDASSALELGKEVDGISGATLSSRAVTEAVKKGVSLFRVLVLEGGSP